MSKFFFLESKFRVGLQIRFDKVPYSLIYVFESNFEIFQILSSNSFDLDPWMILQISIFNKVQILSFKYPFESIQTSHQKFEILIPIPFQLSAMSAM
jgi:hypothetical protein